MVSSPTRTGGKSPLAQWFNESIALEDMRVRFRLSGNNLHILCEAEYTPDQPKMLARLLPALQTVNLNTLIPANQPTIYQVFLYGKGRSGNRAEWTYPIDLSQLDHHLAQFQEMQLQAFGLLADDLADEDEGLPDPTPATPPASRPSTFAAAELAPIALSPKTAAEPEAVFTLDPPTTAAPASPAQPDAAEESIADSEPFTLDPPPETVEPTSATAFPSSAAVAPELSAPDVLAIAHADSPEPPTLEAPPSTAETSTAETSIAETSETLAAALDLSENLSDEVDAAVQPTAGPSLEADTEDAGTAAVQGAIAQPTVTDVSDSPEDALSLPEIPAPLPLAVADIVADGATTVATAADVADATEVVEGAELVVAPGATEATGLAETTEATNLTDVVADVVEATDALAFVDRAEAAEATESSEATESTAATDTIEAIDAATESTEPTDATDTTQTVDGAEALDGVGAAGSSVPPVFEEAQSGNLGAIARYLAVSLSRQNIAVEVSARALPYPSRSGMDAIAQTAEPRQPQRLWILCESTYSPAPASLAEPLAKQLRALNLQGFRDAVVVVQVRGEPQPDWMLRVDLTPTLAMLREWARWGDVQAITKLLNQDLKAVACGIVSASLQESTLHLFCSPVGKFYDIPQAPLQAQVQPIVEAGLQAIQPQGIHGVTLYGQTPNAETPDWVAWLDLAAAQDPARASSPLERAQEQDWEAIAFLLNRLLNPDQDQQLATGGIRLQLLPKRDRTQQVVLHVMADAPICPTQEAVGVPIARFLKELQVPLLAGVRVYGREAGKKHPLWCHTAAFQERIRMVPEAVPEFAASDAYVGELIAPGGELVLRSDLAAEDLQTAWNQLRDRLSQGIRRSLLASHLFIDPQATTPEQVGQPSWAVAAIWGAAGLLLALQMDWGIARLVQPSQAAQVQRELVASGSVAMSGDLGMNQEQVAGEGAGEDNFIATDAPDQSSDASAHASEDAELPFTPITVESQLQTAQILALESPYPTFNSPQLDEKLLLYYERMKQHAAPADVLIVGSSRALRGIDPVALQQELSALGYGEVTVFNFGINGATAQVVDLLLRQVLEAPQLPRLVVWADGARAFNSNAVDVTYNGIALSPAYQDLRSGRLERPDLSAILDDQINLEPSTEELPVRGLNAPLQASYNRVDRTLSGELGDVSATYPLRDRLKERFQAAIAQLLPSEFAIPAQTAGFADDSLPPESLQSLSEAGRELIDFDGFLPLSLRFNPATYFQEYARVPGRYDSDYADFQLTGIQDQALQDLLGVLSDRQIPVVFINLPLTDEYLDADRRGYEQEFRQFMVEADLQYDNLVFRDLSELWLTGYDYFSDPSHLNRYGAYEVARRLAQDPLIPWAMLTSTEGDRPTNTAQRPQPNPDRP